MPRKQAPAAVGRLPLVIIGLLLLAALALSLALFARSRTTPKQRAAEEQQLLAKTKQQQKKKKTGGIKPARGDSATCAPGWRCTAMGTKEACAMGAMAPGGVEYNGQSCGVEGCRGHCFRKK